MAKLLHDIPTPKRDCSRSHDLAGSVQLCAGNRMNGKAYAKRMTLAAKIMHFSGHPAFADDDIIEEVKKIGEVIQNYRDDGMEHGAAILRAKAEWLDGFISQNKGDCASERSE